VILPHGYTQRAAVISDLPAIERLLASCDAAESEPSYHGLASQIRGIAENDMPRGTGKACVITGDREPLVACASFSLPAYPRPIAFARLQGAVHPQHRRRGLGSYLLHWTEGAARALFSFHRESRPRSLRISFGGDRPDAERLYQRRDFVFHDRSLQLRRDLSAPVAAHSAPPGITTSPWSPHSAHLFYTVYVATHAHSTEASTRTEEEWCADIAADAALRPDLTLVALDGTHPCAFILSEVVPREGHDIGWVWLLRVDPAYRRRGLATSLLSHALTAFAAEGLPEAGLWVDEENTAARATYDRLEFRQHSRLTTYAKSLGPDET